MPSSYPGGLDSLTTTFNDATSTASVHPQHHNDLADAINNIESELGINPSGGSATVASRFSGIASTPPASGEAVRYVSGNGVDTNVGLTPGAPFRTLQAAYTDLPSTGGTLIVAPGRYDMGSGWNLTRGKPVWIYGSVKPPPYIGSGSTIPLTSNCAIIYTSTSATSLIQTTAGTAATLLLGLRFENILFELSNPVTTVALDITAATYGEITGCYFFADKTTGPAAVTAQGFFIRANTTYGGSGSDCSWWHVWNNRCINMALGTFGNDTGSKLSNNFQRAHDNVGLGLTHNNQSCLPFVSFYGGHRCVERDNNIEAYYRGILMDSCWMCVSDGSGGETCDIFVDLLNCKGLRISPLGIAYAPLGSSTPYVANALLVRGDSFVKACVFILPTTWTHLNTQRVYPPTDDSTAPAVDIDATDNIIISGRNTDFQGAKMLTGTGSPNSSVTGSVGDMYRRTDGGSSSTLYIKESGTATNTGWAGHGSPGENIPNQSGQSGKYLTTDGSNAAWGAAPGSPLTIIRNGAADQTAQTTTSLTNATNLVFSTAGTGTDVTFFECFLRLFTSSVSGDVAIGWTVSGPSTMEWGLMHHANTAFAGFGPQATTANPAVLKTKTDAIIVGGTTGTVFFVVLGGLVYGGASVDTVQVQTALNVATGNLVVKANSFLRLTQVAT